MKTTKATLSLFALMLCSIVSCGRREAQPPKPPIAVVQSIPVQQARVINDTVVIRAINRDGTVLLGARSMSPTACAMHARHRYYLEGAARINDPIILITHYELQKLENGHVRTVVTKRVVRSKFHKVLENHFQEPKG